MQSVPITTNVVSSNSEHANNTFDNTLCDKVCQRLVAVWWLSQGTPVSSTNQTERYDITEI